MIISVRWLRHFCKYNSSLQHWGYRCKIVESSSDHNLDRRVILQPNRWCLFQISYLISWTKLEGTRPVSFASLVPFKKPSKFKLEITFIISFFCIMLLFWIKFQFPSKSSEFILSPKSHRNGQWAKSSNIDCRPGLTELLTVRVRCLNVRL